MKTSLKKLKIINISTEAIDLDQSVSDFPVISTALKRDSKVKTTGVGSIRFKEVLLPDGSKKEFPEFEDVRKKAQELGIPVYQVYSRL